MGFCNFVHYCGGGNVLCECFSLLSFRYIHSTFNVQSKFPVFFVCAEATPINTIKVMYTYTNFQRCRKSWNFHIFQLDTMIWELYEANQSALNWIPVQPTLTLTHTLTLYNKELFLHFGVRDSILFWGFVWRKVFIVFWPEQGRRKLLARRWRQNIRKKRLSKYKAVSGNLVHT